MKIKRLLSLLLAVALVVSLTGCGSKNNGGKSNGSGNSDSAATNPEAKYDGIENPYADLDLDGASIRIAAPWNIKPGEEGSSTANTLEWERIHYLEEKYNCKFEFITSEDSDKLTSSVAAGDPYTDFIVMYTNTIPSYAMNGYLQNMDDLQSIDLTETKWNNASVQMGAFNNAHYAFCIGSWQPRYLIAFNKTMFEKNGWESPYELYKNDNWTWDKFLEIAQKATDKTAGRYGFGGRSLLTGSAIASFGGSIVSINDKGIPVFTGNSANCQQAIQFLSDLNKKYDVVWEPATSTWASYINALAEGTVAMAVTQLYLIRENILDMEDDYGIVPIPKASTAEGRYASVAGDVPTYVMPANNPLAQEKAYILDLFTEPYPGYEDILSRAEMETYCRDEESVEILLDIEKKYGMFSYSIWFTQASSLYSEATSAVISGTSTFAEAIGGKQAQIEQSIADVYASWNE